MKAGRARPKSQIFSLQSELARMFLGLRSRWNTCEWSAVQVGQQQAEAGQQAEARQRPLEGGVGSCGGLARERGAWEVAAEEELHPGEGRLLPAG